MIDFRPFTGFIPHKNIAYKVAAKSIDKYSNEELAQELQNNPQSFLNVIVPDASQLKSYKSSLKNVLGKSRAKFFEMVNEGIFEKIENAYLLFTQVKAKRRYNGIIGLVNIENYINRDIKIHEDTLAHKEVKLKNYLDEVKLHAEPVFLTQPFNKTLNMVFTKTLNHTPFLSFEGADGNLHEIRLITQDIDLVQSIFKSIDHLYLADGHHRCASSVLYGLDQKAMNAQNHTGNEPYNFILAAVFDSENLELFEFNRLIRSEIFRNNIELFLKKSKDYFEIEKSDSAFLPQYQAEFAVYTHQQWYHFKLKNMFIGLSSQPDEQLDTSLLSKYLLEPVFGIKDLRNDKNVGFVGGKTDLNFLQQKVDSGSYDFAIVLHPVLRSQFEQVSDAGRKMPPKSTWFEPKFLTGLTVFSLE